MAKKVITKATKPGPAKKPVQDCNDCKSEKGKVPVNGIPPNIAVDVTLTVRINEKDDETGTKSRVVSLSANVDNNVVNMVVTSPMDIMPLLSVSDILRGTLHNKFVELSKDKNIKDAFDKANEQIKKQEKAEKEIIAKPAGNMYQ